MTYGATINQSPVIAGTLAAAITGEPMGLVVKFNNTGKFAVAGVGDIPAGVIIAGQGENPAQDAEVTVQIKDIALVKANGTIAKGAAVTTDANGTIKAASAGDFVLGFALAPATSGSIIPVQITKSGIIAVAVAGA